MTGKIEYQIMVLLMDNFNESELKIWAFKYAKELQNLGASEISVISRGQRELAYSIEEYTKSNFIEINFTCMPKQIDIFSKTLNFDSNVLRMLILNKQKEKSKVFMRS